MPRMTCGVSCGSAAGVRSRLDRRADESEDSGAVVLAHDRRCASSRASRDAHSERPPRPSSGRPSCQYRGRSQHTVVHDRPLPFHNGWPVRSPAAAFPARAALGRPSTSTCGSDHATHCADRGGAPGNRRERGSAQPHAQPATLALSSIRAETPTRRLQRPCASPSGCYRTHLHHQPKAAQYGRVGHGRRRTSPRILRRQPQEAGSSRTQPDATRSAQGPISAGQGAFPLVVAGVGF
jgi:hypothetical protein